MSFLKWTVFIPIGLVIYLCGIWLAHCYIPSEEEILQALNTSRLVNTQQREAFFSNIADDPLVCPMARYHAQRDPVGGKELDIITNDLIDAYGILLSLGKRLLCKANEKILENKTKKVLKNGFDGRPLRREQINTLTSFLDGSSLYGVTSEAKELAKAPGGLLKDESYGPPEYNSSECSKDVHKTVFSTVEGERKLHVVPSLTAFQTLFIREHNRIAEELRSTFLSDDDLLFEEARRVLVAVLQKIVYDEFLPAILPNRTIVKYKLTSEYNYTYEPSTNPSVSNEFGLAFRFGHTWNPDYMYLLDSDLYNGPANETEAFLGKSDIRLRLFATRILNESAPQTDRQIENSVRNFLFLNRNMISYDLAAISIQRGRDHGVPAYYKYRQYCGLSGLNRFDQLIHHDLRTRQRLSTVYRHVKDIDLYTGLLSEMAIYGGEVGPTLACILGQQFKRMKYGDRYWYQGEDDAFNSTQIAAIQGYTLAKLLCNHLNFTEVNYPNAFLLTDPLTACDGIPQPDLSSFKTTE